MLTIAGASIKIGRRRRSEQIYRCEISGKQPRTRYLAGGVCSVARMQSCKVQRAAVIARFGEADGANAKKFNKNAWGSDRIQCNLARDGYVAR
jgi:hypothetical protein